MTDDRYAVPFVQFEERTVFRHSVESKRLECLADTGRFAHPSAFDECRRKIIEGRGKKMRVSGLALSVAELRTSAIEKRRRGNWVSVPYSSRRP